MRREDYFTGKRYFLTEGKKSGILLRENDDILCWIGNNDFGISCYKPGMKNCFCRELSLMYKGCGNLDLNDTNYPYEFNLKRIVGIQMN